MIYWKYFSSSQTVIFHCENTLREKCDFRNYFQKSYIGAWYLELMGQLSVLKCINFESVEKLITLKGKGRQIVVEEIDPFSGTCNAGLSNWAISPLSKENIFHIWYVLCSFLYMHI